MLPCITTFKRFMRMCVVCVYSKISWLHIGGCRHSRLHCFPLSLKRRVCAVCRQAGLFLNSVCFVMTIVWWPCVCLGSGGAWNHKRAEWCCYKCGDAAFRGSIPSSLSDSADAKQTAERSQHHGWILHHHDQEPLSWCVAHSFETPETPWLHAAATGMGLSCAESRCMGNRS